MRSTFCYCHKSRDDSDGNSVMTAECMSRPHWAWTARELNVNCTWTATSSFSHTSAHSPCSSVMIMSQYCFCNHGTRGIFSTEDRGQWTQTRFWRDDSSTQRYEPPWGQAHTGEARGMFGWPDVSFLQFIRNPVTSIRGVINDRFLI